MVILWEISDQLEMMVRVKIMFVLDPPKSGSHPESGSKYVFKIRNTMCRSKSSGFLMCPVFFSQDQCINAPIQSATASAQRPHFLLNSKMPISPKEVEPT